MEILNSAALIVGYIVLVLAVGFVLLLCFDFENNAHLTVFTFLGFGIIVAKSEEYKAKVNKWRQTTGRTVFITAPAWFNRIWNIGGIKKVSE